MKPPRPIDELLDRGWSFDFFQAVRLLELSQPEKSPVGRDAFAEDEAVRFRAWLSFAFPPSQIRKVSPGEDSDPYEMVVAFMGLYGSQGALPRHYTEVLLERARTKDHALRDFLDIFNHRMISLFFRANEKYRFPSNYRSTLDDPISSVLTSLLGTPEPARDLPEEVLPRRHLLRYVGLFSQRPRSVSGMEAVVGDYFDGLPVQVQQFVGRWVNLPSADRGCLDDARGTNQLGRTVVIGRRIHDRQGKFRIRLGPLDMQHYLAFQPDGRLFDSLCALTREFVGDHLTFDVQPVLRADQVPLLQLSKARRPAVRLGRTAWLGPARRRSDADDARFEAPDSTRLRVQGRQPC